MPYPALPDRRMPYDNDGTLVYEGTIIDGATTAMSGANLLELQDDDFVSVGTARSQGQVGVMFVFFPEQREVTGLYTVTRNGVSEATSFGSITTLLGSNDTVNGLDGTWETASLPSGVPSYVDAFSWRAGIVPVSFAGPKKNIRVQWAGVTDSSNAQARLRILHVYGEAAGGQMAHDLVFIDHDDTPGVEFTAAEDFGDQPLGTTVVRQFRVKNTSATRTATNINIQCNDADFTIAESGSGPWVATINIASLAAGAESATMYTKCTTPAPGAPLNPRFARIVVLCDAGFYG